MTGSCTQRRPILYALLAAVVLVANVPAHAQPANTAGGRILVMPFEVRPREARTAWLGEAASVLLSDDVMRLGQEAYTREERLQAFEQLQVPGAASLSHATVIKVGRLLGATHIVTGAIDTAGEATTIRAHVIRLDQGKMIAERIEQGAIGELYRLIERLAQTVTQRGSMPAAPWERPPLGAFELYIKGLIAESRSARIGFLDKALAAAPGYARAQLALWDVYASAGEDQRALRQALAVKESSSMYPRARFAAALSYIQLRQYDAAFSTLQAIAAGRSAVPALNNLGVVQLRRGSTPQTGRATYYFNKAAEGDTEDPDYCFNLGYAYWLDRDPQAALYWLREAVRRDPADADAHAVLAATLLAAGKEAESTRERELAKQLSSKYADGKALDASLGSLERIKPTLDSPRAPSIQTALATPERRDQREMAAFHLDRGRALFAEQRDTEAMAELKRSVFLSPYEAEPHLLLGQIYLRTRRLAEAIGALKISIWSDETAAAHVTLAEAYADSGVLAAARLEIDRALALDPGSAEARRVLERLRAPSPPR